MKPKQLTVRKEVMISEKQAETLKKLKSYGVNVNQFIRAAIREKIQREYKQIKEPKIRIKPPF